MFLEESPQTSHLQLNFVSEISGCSYSMFVSDFVYLVENSVLDRGRVSGEFTFIKKGANYGMQLEKSSVPNSKSQRDLLFEYLESGKFVISSSPGKREYFLNSPDGTFVICRNVEFRNGVLKDYATISFRRYVANRDSFNYVIDESRDWVDFIENYRED